MARLQTGKAFTMYEWIKALHVIAVIAWMAGMLYLPRLFVYHCETETGSKASETFKVMERRLLKVIINPAMIVTWLAGLYLAWAGHWFSAGWLHGKLLLVVVLGVFFESLPFSHFNFCLSCYAIYNYKSTIPVFDAVVELALKHDLPHF